LKIPNPRSSTLFPFTKAAVIHPKTASTMPALSCLVRPVAFANSSLKSAFVIGQIPGLGLAALTRNPLRAPSAAPLARAR